MRTTFVILALLIGASLAFCHTTYTGYSGAPGTGATCASSCHGSGTGTITVTGFPTSYTPGQAYTVTVSRTGTTNIANFNASVRVGTGAVNAGVIAAGSATAVYNVAGETNGVHFASGPQPSGTFVWTAPGAGMGAVTLYLGGHQGTSSGPNNEFALVSNEAVAIPPAAPQAVVLFPDAALARLYWPPVSGAAGYRVYRTTLYESPIAPANLIGSTTDTSFVDSTALSAPDIRGFYVVTASTP